MLLYTATHVAKLITKLIIIIIIIIIITRLIIVVHVERIGLYRGL